MKEMARETKLSEVTEHYDKLLSEHYTWMFGIGFDAKVTEQREILRSVLPSEPLKLGVDLGCGSGFQSVALTQLGVGHVIAIDSSAALLQELEQHKAQLSIETIHADILELSRFVDAGQVSVAVCMGDTITHLPSKADVEHLFKEVRTVLAPGGVFILTFRDLTGELQGLDRFIPVHSDSGKIMTCFLEFESSEAVRVHDLIHTHDAGGWSLRKSSYRKLRLSPAWVVEKLTSAGFSIRSAGPLGRLSMVCAVGAAA